MEPSQIDILQAHIAQLEAKLARAKEALEIFASDESWRIDGICDANGCAFDGQDIAQKALKELTDEKE